MINEVKNVLHTINATTDHRVINFKTLVDLKLFWGGGERHLYYKVYSKGKKTNKNNTFQMPVS